MRIGLVSHYPTAISNHADTRRRWQFLRQVAVTLRRQGLEVLWLSSTDTAEVLKREADLISTGEQDLPGTCRYVIPCRSFRLDGVRLFCTDRELWRQPDLHTRLFTFLGLLHRELACDVWHAWGALSALYLGVYTARFLGLPAVVTYSRPWLYDGPGRSFARYWVGRHVDMALVTKPEDRRHLLDHHNAAAERVDVMPSTPAAAARKLTALYQRLLAG